MKEAGVGKGIVGAIKGKNVDLSSARTGVSKNMAKSIGRAASEAGQEMLSGGLSKARTGGLTSKIQGLKDAERSALEDRAGRYQVRGLNAGKEKQDAAKERQVASRYKGNFDPRKVVPEGGPQPGVTSRGSFSLYSKKKKR